MQLLVKVIPLRAGTSEPVGEPRLLRCPPDVAPDTILSFLTERLGEAIDTAWTSTREHTPLAIGWVFPAAPAIAPHEAAEVACVPFTEASGGSLQPLFEVHADLRAQSTQRAGSHDGDTTVVRQPHRAYHPAAGHTGQDTTTPGAPSAEPVGELDQALAAIARHTGATLRIYPRPGRAVRRVSLRDSADVKGRQFGDGPDRG